MRTANRFRKLGMGVLFGGALLLRHANLADAASDAHGDQVVARVGAVAITAGDVERRLRAVPRFQLVTFGKSPDEVRRHFLERVLIPETLFAAGAAAEKLDNVAPTRDRVEEILRTARIAAIKAELASAGVTHDEMARYYQDNVSRFQAPERLSLWRILCANKEEALAVIADAKKDGRPQHWNDLARDHSMDKSTAMRGGSLGLIAADGSAAEPNIKVDPHLFTAAASAKDGEIVGDPVPEGNGFAVLWRRGSTPAVRRTLEDEEPALRQVVLRAKLEQSVKDLIKMLRVQNRVEESPALVDTISIDGSGQMEPRRRPGVVPRKPVGRPEPLATPRGLR